ncbi:MAG TPA: hypothetical protein PLP73_00890 [Candidatus Absconditabacterales bacterium]|nr:hypothetical protein [Candidatus Absconditabacterales bacterium]HRU50144.1 hypothetical protein [Candidatus Absconditabacterales bacterium]
MTNSLLCDDEILSQEKEIMMNKEEFEEIYELEKLYQTEIDKQRALIPPEEIEERMLKLKTKAQYGIKMFNLYKEPIDLFLMINDYLDTAKKDGEKPTLPGLLVHLNMTKQQMSEMLEIGDEFSRVLSMGLLKIEALLLDMGLSKKLDNRILSLALKNYHGLSEKIQTEEKFDYNHKIQVIIKPAITEELDLDDRIIEME